MSIRRVSVILLVVPAALSLSAYQPAAQPLTAQWDDCRREDAALTNAEKIAACTQVIGSDGRHQAEAYFHRGTLRYADGDYSGAIGDMTDSIRLSPQNPDAFVNRGNAHLVLRDYPRAVADYDQAISMDSQHAAAFMHRGIAFSRLGDNARAISDYGNAIRLDPSLAEAFMDRGNAFVAIGDYPSAIADYSEAIRLIPNYDKAYNGRCWARALTRDRLELALEDCNQSLNLRPNDPAALDSRGLVNLMMGDNASAFVDYDAAVGGDPEYVDSLYGRGLAQLRLGRERQGRVDLETAIARDPEVSSRFRELQLEP